MNFDSSGSDSGSIEFILVRGAQQITVLTLESRVSGIATSFIPRSSLPKPEINSQCYKNLKWGTLVVELVPTEINKGGRSGCMRGTML